MQGIYEFASERLKQLCYENFGVVKLNFIADYIKFLQKNKFDAHVCIMGANGMGKSLLGLELVKLIDPTAIKKRKLVFASTPVSNLISKITEEKESAIFIDEAKSFFNYKRSMTLEQVLLVNQIEYARDNMNAFVVCTNDIRRLNNNYRNSKVQVLLWIMDRFKKVKGGIIGYSAVFVANPSVEAEDKFEIDIMDKRYNTEGLRIIAENTSTFIGYHLIKDISYYLTKEDLDIYYQEKEKAKKEIAIKSIKRLAGFQDKNDGDKEE